MDSVRNRGCKNRPVGQLCPGVDVVRPKRRYHVFSPEKDSTGTVSVTVCGHLACGATITLSTLVDNISKGVPFFLFRNGGAPGRIYGHPFRNFEYMNTREYLRTNGIKFLSGFPPDGPDFAPERWVSPEN